MANTKIENLGELTAPISTDILPIVDDPGVTPITKKVTIANLLAVYDDQTATLTGKSIVASQLTGTIADAQMPNLTGAITTVEGAVETTLVANAVDSDHYTDASIDSEHLSSGLTITDPTLTFSINAQTDNYTTVLADAGKIITSNKGTAVVITIPLNSSVSYPIGSSINVISIGVGLTNFAATVGVTINSTGAVPAAPVLRAQHSSATAIKIATDTWQVVGDIS